ncbi:MAG: hypothetical protein AB1779_06840 [Candidatus Thermoplasmatota archaeon]
MSYSSQPAPYRPLLQPKMGKVVLILWFVLIVIGIVLAVVLPVTVRPMGAKTAKELRNNWNETTLKFDSYKVGDIIKLKGKITNKTKLPSEARAYFKYRYVYGIDGVAEKPDFWFYADKDDVGSVGDEILVEVKVEEFTFSAGDITTIAHFLVYHADVSLIFYLIPGVVVLIVGIIMIVIGLIKRKKAVSPMCPPPTSYIYLQVMCIRL